MSSRGLFGPATASLRRADSESAGYSAALLDNERLWSLVLERLQDPSNGLPPTTRTALVSLARSAQGELAKPTPNAAFLIAINDAFATNLAGQA